MTFLSAFRLQLSVKLYIVLNHKKRILTASNSDNFPQEVISCAVWENKRCRNFDCTACHARWPILDRSGRKGEVTVRGGEEWRKRGEWDIQSGLGSSKRRFKSQADKRLGDLCLGNHSYRTWEANTPSNIYWVTPVQTCAQYYYYMHVVHFSGTRRTLLQGRSKKTNYPKCANRHPVDSILQNLFLSLSLSLVRRSESCCPLLATTTYYVHRYR